MCTSCGCRGQGTTMTNLQTGVRAEIAAGPEHDGAAHSHGEHGHGHFHGEHQHAHDHHHGHEQGHAHGHDHSHAHAHDHSDHDQAHEDSHRRLDLEARILAKNDAIAAKCRAWLAGREILALNLVSSPGAGKTTLLERAIADLSGELPLFVIEGDQATSNDGERIRAAGAPVVQVNTGTGCHLDAEMIARALSELKPSVASLVFIENVGNLVCPALFDLGEHAKAVIFSTTEGEDKPLKYPHMFSAAKLVIFNKIDLLPHLDFSMERARENILRVNPDVEIVEVSAKTGAGMRQLYDWIRAQRTAVKEQALV
ncbi:hydrogenase nickel incorporation protein HypB [Methylocystis sp. SB2]|uniref:hydrogenase nickel incorporation protein HypB n=1 Tax=Methylocystis sp. (strain SB2) TaxID=743836 RepID=UPI0004A27A5F|nr:hydrogenase nickel incorporation protein HypB [Methylocystis sp. SB2]ULO23370.1 hydrogenase nickel incorporation protein HypB [Methylocystis sp. SB2]